MPTVGAQIQRHPGIFLVNIHDGVLNQNDHVEDGAQEDIKNLALLFQAHPDRHQRRQTRDRKRLGAID